MGEWERRKEGRKKDVPCGPAAGREIKRLEPVCLHELLYCFWLAVCEGYLQLCICSARRLCELLIDWFMQQEAASCAAQCCLVYRPWTDLGKLHSRSLSICLPGNSSFDWFLLHILCTEPWFRFNLYINNTCCRSDHLSHSLFWWYLFQCNKSHGLIHLLILCMFGNKYDCVLK